MMSHLHASRNQQGSSEISVIKQTVQYAFFLLVFLWLLYQIHHSIYVRHDTDCDFTNDHPIAQVLGRKGSSSVRVGKSLYTEEVELYGVDLIGDALSLNNDTDTDTDANGDNHSDKPDYYEANNNNDNNGAGNQSTENGGAKAENLEMFRFSDENGVPEDESDIMTEIIRKGVVSKAGNQTENVDPQTTVSGDERPNMTVVSADKGSKRDLFLLSES